MAYLVTKTYDHNEGLSVAFRQWRATSHCRFIHGYSLAFEFTFASETLDELNWVIDFGALKPLRDWLHKTFDHRLIIAFDDPYYSTFCGLHTQEIADILFIDDVSCECFAKMAFDAADNILSAQSRDACYSDKGLLGICLISVKVSEHSGNSAIYTPPQEIK